MCSPCGVGQDRHCTPYMGPRSPSGPAHSSQMDTPRSCSQRASESPRRNQSSSMKMLRVWSFLVVTRGNPLDRSKRIWCPNTDSVPVPVRSDFLMPCSRTWRMSCSYCCMMMSGSQGCRLSGCRPRLPQCGGTLNYDTSRAPELLPRPGQGGQFKTHVGYGGNTDAGYFTF